jgi:hypothetical protein
MNETVIITSEMAIDWLSTFSFFFQLFCSFLIAFFTISYSLYLREKREFEAAVVSFLAEFEFFETCVNTDLKPAVISQIEKLESHPDESAFAIMQFPSISFSSIDFLFSRGNIPQLGLVNFQTLISLKYQITKLDYQKDVYFLLIKHPNGPLTTVELNKYSLDMLKSMKKLLDAIDVPFQQFKPPKYSLSFRQYLSGFVFNH